MNCVKCVMSCKRVLIAKLVLSAVHSRFLSFRRSGRRLSEDFDAALAADDSERLLAEPLAQRDAHVVRYA